MLNVLFLTYDFPYPTTSGGKNRAYHLLKYTAQKENVFLYSFVREDYNPENNDEILKLGVKDIKVHKRKPLKSVKNVASTVMHNSSIFKTLYFDDNVLQELRTYVMANKIDLIHFESTYTGFYIGENFGGNVKQVLGTENIEFQLYLDYAKTAKFFAKPIVHQQALQLKKEEIAMAKKAHLTTTITQSEAETLFALTGKECGIVANGIEPDNFTYSYNSRVTNNLLFVGNFDYFPNVDAVEFIYKHVFPKLDKRLTLTIVGKNCNTKFKFADKRIIKKDFVEDIIAEYKNADILLFPIRIGGGTNFKVLEAMALGIPIVAHPERLAGLRAQADDHFLAASTGVEYVEQINRLYVEIGLRKTLSQNARGLIEKHYAWEGIGRELIEYWRGL